MSKNFTGWRIIAPRKGEVELEPWQIDAPAPGEVVVQCLVSLVSPGTELSRVHDTHRVSRGFPTAIGYLAAGRIAALGEGVTKWQVGDRVVAPMGHVSYGKMPADHPNLLPSPDGLDLYKAVFAGMASIAMRGVMCSGLQQGETALVIGQGLIGLLATFWCKHFGARRVAAFERWPKRLEVSRQLGADEAVDPGSDLAAATRAALGPDGADVVIEATGTPNVIANTFELTADNGRIVVLGGVHKDVKLDLYTHFQKRNLKLIGAGYASMASGTGTEPANRLRCLRLIADGTLPVERLITHKAPVQEAPQLYRAMVERPNEVLGVVFEWPE